jgi:hypothetical protein
VTALKLCLNGPDLQWDEVSTGSDSDWIVAASTLDLTEPFRLRRRMGGGASPRLRGYIKKEMGLGPWFGLWPTSAGGAKPERGAQPFTFLNRNGEA